MHLFYIEHIEGEFCLLPEEESKHCTKVLRLRIHDELNIIDGKGNWYRAEIFEIQGKKCLVKILDIQKEYGKRNFRLHLALAPTKNIERTECLLEKCTEIGIDEISFLLTDHCERKNIKLERLNKIVVSAMKQSYKAYLPKLNDLISFKDFISNVKETNCFIAHCHEADKVSIKNAYTPGEDVLILIGPEGDFSTKEVELALHKGFKALTLSNSRLRTETAGIVACNSINFMNGV